MNRPVSILACSALCLSLAGCNIVAPIGGMLESARRQGTTDFDAEYAGLDGKTFAVVVVADRVIQAEHPAVIARFSTELAERLKKETQAKGYIPGQRMLQFQFDNPRWVAWGPGELGKKLGVDRLVYLELLEYRLVDPGNKYTWKGVCRASLSVAEIDGSSPDDYAYRKSLVVRYPDSDGYGPGEMKVELVNTVLTNRMIDRASWLLYKHTEKNDLKY